MAVLRCLGAIASLAVLLALPTRAPAGTVTNQSWSFDKAPANFGNITPDATDNPGATLDVPAGGGWVPTFMGHSGILTPDGPMFFTVPNKPNPNMFKVLTVQIIYQFPADGNLLGQPNVVDENGTAFTFAGSRTVTLDDGWLSFTATFAQKFCPAQETVIIDGPVGGNAIFVDRVFIHTECIPEPSTLTLAGSGIAVGLVGAAWRRRKRADVV
jgi:PEP-CTERM motif